MTIEKDGGPAFGQVVDLRCVRVEMEGGTEWEPHVLADSGMRLRDYFAAKALSGLLSCQSEETGFYAPANAAEEAYKMADAMLEARKK